MLKTAQVVLTPVTDDDLPVMLNWINDREQAIFNAPYKPVSLLQHQEWFESVQRRSDMQLFGVRLSETGELIGTCQLHSINRVHRSAELQIRLGDVQQRGKGYGTEAVRLLLEFAFKDLNLHRVNLHVFSTNHAAIRVYEKVGFAREGLLRSAAYINGEYVDVLVMGILQNEYAGHEGSSDPPT
jgi:RimJ/RimL family protein N-acetyltransferase